MSIKEITKKIEALPSRKRKEVERFIKRVSKTISSSPEKNSREKDFDFSWEGLLAEEGKKHTSVELQHLIWEEEMKKYGK